MNQRMYEVLTAIVNYRKSRKVSPTVTELTWMVSLTSKSTVAMALNELIAEGYIARAKRIPRGLKVLKPLPSTFYAAKTADQRKGKTEGKKKQSEAARMQEMRAAKEEHRKCEEDRLNAAVELGLANDARARRENFMNDLGGLFASGRVRGLKVG